ncbi:thrombospondin-2-like isoform X1 [Mercenaria mercenaria]|uniref:thrombospondin-2-like isoform X1 n=1 Tax=Mercenaria mercenaria TaxID=6596 RepID=UPI00234F2B64|nr:thrombospondin-2-like isoform X1 [Mercenaria mercenaria]
MNILRQRDACYIFCVYESCHLTFLDALDCYTCTNATYVSECKSTTTCNAEEICFSDHIQTSYEKMYPFGCRAEAKCSSIIQDGNSADSGSVVGRSASPGTCSECCKNQHCNRQLCQHSFSDKECSDGTEMNCKSVGSLVNICTDTQHAKTVCERFCGLCSYADGSWSTWLTWSSCDVTCGNGTQTRIRKCTEPSPSGGGHDCAGMSQEAQTCTEESCPVHGAWAT